ncbi:MAG: heme ABC transporter ATP-binding protein [Pseudomonadota bacterium]
MNASVIRTGRAILDGVSAECQAGTFTALCGPNGAGKTTALRVMTGSLKPDQGEARIDDERVQKIERGDLARRRAVVSQASALNFPFQVYEVVTMGRAPHFGTPWQRFDEKVVSQAMQAMDVFDLAERNYLTLSGGERKRVDIARALAQVWDAPDNERSRWLFLDEPTGALDLKHQIKLMQRLTDLASGGIGIVAVLHDLHLVQQYADRVWLFNSGKLIENGAARSVLTPNKIQHTFDLDAPFSLD